MTNPLDAIATYRVCDLSDPKTHRIIGWVIFKHGDNQAVSRLETRDEAQAECNRLNAIGFLEALMEPSDEMLEEMSQLFRKAWWGADNNSRRDAWQAMIKAKIDQLKETK